MKPLKLAIIAVSAILLLSFVGCAISNTNREVGLRNQFTQKMSERQTFYEKMWKTISQKTQISLRNDSSFRENINIIMAGRKDAPQVFFKWITETNPNANYEQVAALYKDLSRTIESEREGFFQQEKVLQDVKLQHDNLLSKFPSNLVLTIFNRHKIKYIPISSDRTDEVFSTGKDNDVKLFE